MSLSPGIGAVNFRQSRSGTTVAAGSGLVRFRRLRRVIPRDAVLPHQPRDPMAADPDTLPLQLARDALSTVSRLRRVELHNQLQQL
jgi:hypothetical protein